MFRELSDHIEVTGQILVGIERTLQQSAEAWSVGGQSDGGGRPDGRAMTNGMPRRAPAGELAMRRIRYRLDPTTSSVYIRDSGLTTSYGIFGAPGSGKTNLLKHLLRQVFALNAADPNKKYGGLILDPKASLIDDVRKIVRLTGRSDDDLIVLNTDELRGTPGVNVIGVDLKSLKPYELGKQLVLAARSAGVSTSDPYWLLAWGNLFGAALYLLSLVDDQPVTMRSLLQAVLSFERDQSPPQDTCGSAPDDRLVRPIQNLARKRKLLAQSELHRGATPEQKGLLNDMLLAASEIENFFRQENDNLATIEAIITNAYSPFQRSEYACYSADTSPALMKSDNRTYIGNFYDRIIDEGKIVLVSLSPSEPAVAKTLCTLIKCLFQRSVLSRKERVRTGKLRNWERPLVLACDEFSQVSSEVPGEPLGDGYFFSLSRENGCMGLIATQSVNVLEASSLKEAWRSVFSNMGAKVFMRLVDNETVEEATKLAGEYEVYLTSEGISMGAQGFGTSGQTDRREIKALPSHVLTQLFRKGDAVVLGSFDGSDSPAVTRFVHVPKFDI